MKPGRNWVNLLPDPKAPNTSPSHDFSRFARVFSKSLILKTYMNLRATWVGSPTRDMSGGKRGLAAAPPSVQIHSQLSTPDISHATTLLLVLLTCDVHHSMDFCKQQQGREGLREQCVHLSDMGSML